MATVMVAKVCIAATADVDLSYSPASAITHTPFSTFLGQRESPQTAS